MPFLAAVNQLSPHIGLAAWLAAGMILAEAALRVGHLVVNALHKDDPHDAASLVCRSQAGLTDGLATSPSLLVGLLARGCTTLFCLFAPPADAHAMDHGAAGRPGKAARQPLSGLVARVVRLRAALLLSVFPPEDPHLTTGDEIGDVTPAASLR